MTKEFATYREIITQTEAWSQAIETVDEKKISLKKIFQEPYKQIIFTGCGSTYYLSLAASALFQELTGKIAKGVPAGELLLNPKSVYPGDEKILLVAVSRSGESTETVMAVDQFIKNNKGTVITITNSDQKPFSEIGAENLVSPAGQEESIAQTRAFTSMYVCATAVAAAVAGREDLFDLIKGLPAAGKELMGQYEPFAKELGEDLELDRFYFLGSGARYGLACEANLKMKEMTLTHSEPFHFFEFRHGPKSMVQKTAAISAFLSSSSYSQEKSVVNEMKELGARIITTAQQDADIRLPTALPEEIVNVLYIPVMQLTAYYRSLAKGLNPDRPNHLDKFVKLDYMDG